MEEGKGERYLASGRQYGNALLGVRHQEEEGECGQGYLSCMVKNSYGELKQCRSFRHFHIPLGKQ